LLYKTNSSFQARASLDTITLPVTDPITEAEYQVRVIDGSIALPTLDIAKNAGNREKLQDYAAVKEMEAQVSMEEILGDQVFGDGSGSDDFDGLQKLIHEDPTSQTDVGGIDPSASDNGYWRNYSYDTAVTAFNANQAGLDAIDTSLNNSTFGRQGPKLIVTTAAVFTLFQLGLTALMRYKTTDENSGAIGFKALEYAGMPVVFDSNCPAGNLYGIDTTAIRLQVLAQGDMKQTPFLFHTDKLLESALIYFFANVTAGARRTSFVIDSITG
jgi:hypothetical protein